MTEMKVVHELSFERRCPVNDETDRYELKVETADLITVEQILAAVNSLPEKAYQEEHTQMLAAKLVGCTVTVTGMHSGVKTTCIVQPS